MGTREKCGTRGSSGRWASVFPRGSGERPARPPPRARRDPQPRVRGGQQNQYVEYEHAVAPGKTGNLGRLPPGGHRNRSGCNFNAK